MKLYEKHTASEIAEMYGASNNTVYSWISRQMGKLTGNRYIKKGVLVCHFFIAARMKYYGKKTSEQLEFEITSFLKKSVIL